MTTESKEFNLATADKFELKKFAKEEYQLALRMNMSEATMRQHIQVHCEDNNLELPVSEIGADIPGQKKVKKVTINIATSEGKLGDEPVFLGLQGIGCTIPRGINVKVSPAIVEILKNAMQDIITQDTDTGELLHRHVLTYPFQFVSEAV